jgi:hypothetical protein
MNATADTCTDDKPDQHPMDVHTMREATAQLIGPDDGPEALPPTGEELATLTLQIRGHLQLMIPEVEKLARRKHRDSIPRFCALACVGEARRKLTAPQAVGSSGEIAYARRLARSLNAMCTHYVELGGAQ